MASRNKRTLRQRGQSAVEMALVFPLLVLLAVGVFDMGRAYSVDNQVNAMAREGARIGSLADIAIGGPGCTGPLALRLLNCAGASSVYPNGGGSDSDIGAAVRLLGSSSLNLEWGLASSHAVGGTDDNCSNAYAGNCGDPHGCATNSAFWTDSTLPSQEPATACFAVRIAYYSAGKATSYSNWNERPTCAIPQSPTFIQCWQTSQAGGTYMALDVRVVVKFTVITPFIADAVGNDGNFYITADAIILPQY